MSKKVCLECDTLLRPQYVAVPTKQTGTLSDVQQKETEYCPFCGGKACDVITKEACDKHSDYKESCTLCVVTNHVEENKEAYRKMGES